MCRFVFVLGISFVRDERSCNRDCQCLHDGLLIQVEFLVAESH